MFKFRSGSTGLGEDMGHWKRRAGGVECKVCGTGEEETREHVIFDCSAYTEERAKWEAKMGEIVDGWDSLNREERLVILLSQPLSVALSRCSDPKSSTVLLGGLRTTSLNYLLVLWDTRIEGMYGDSHYKCSDQSLSVLSFEQLWS
jgi:hypothetical protein